MANAYMYQAALWCEKCITAVKEQIAKEHPEKVPQNPMDEDTFDSDDYPKGPYPDGGGESDAPEHCDACHVFLENNLTADGQEYLMDALAEYVTDSSGTAEVLDEWADHIEGYGLEGDRKHVLDMYRAVRKREEPPATPRGMDHLLVKLITKHGTEQLLQAIIRARMAIATKVADGAGTGKLNMRTWQGFNDATMELAQTFKNSVDEQIDLKQETP